MSSSFVAIDYSQIEMRLAAHMSQDPKMLEIFRTGKDIHSMTVSWIKGIRVEDVNAKVRKAFKAVGFGVMYGMSAMGLKDKLEEEDVQKPDGSKYNEGDCQILINEWFGLYKGVGQMMANFVREAEETGMVRDIFGRPRFIPEMESCIPKVREAGIRQAGNAPIQSGAQGIIKQAMGDIYPIYRAFGSKAILQIHDELMWEIEKDMINTVVPVFKYTMENAVKLSVPTPCDVEIGENWQDMKEKEEPYV